MRVRLPGALGQSFRAAHAIGLMLMAFVLAVQVNLGDSEEVPWRHDWWDRMHKWSPRDRGDPGQAPVVIVAIDKAVMDVNGAWPWPRDKLAEVVSKISSYQPSVIAFDIILSNPDPQSPSAMAAEHRLDGRDDVAAILEQYQDTDAFFFQILRDGWRHYQTGEMIVPAVPSVLPVTGLPIFDDAMKGQGCDFLPPPVDVPKGGLGLRRGFDAAVPPLPTFTQQKRGLQVTSVAAIDFNASRDFVVRRVKAVQRVCESHLLILGAEALRVGNDMFSAQVAPTDHGMQISLGLPGEPGALTFPAERNGDFWLYFGEKGSEADVLKRYVSALSLFSEDFDPALIKGKVVLLAVTDLGRIDERKSPLGDTIWGIEAHAQMIEQIVAGDFMRRPWFMFVIETALMGVVCLMVILLVPRLPPVISLLLVPLGVASLLYLSLLLFGQGLLTDFASPALALTIVGGGVIGMTLFERDRARLVSEIELQSERADRSFLQGELDAAARIQTALLPPRRFVREGEVDLACYIDPARTVGGDFYDHFMVDGRQLFFLVADVSGKGADASQFMLLSKTLWKSVALRTGTPLEKIQLEANSEITRENTATMFVTGLCGLLDLESGKLSYSSAGHDAPYLFADGRRPEQLQEFSGPPAGLVEGIEFPVGHLRLAAGDRLCIFTDGVTEAMDVEGELFGLERLEAAIGAAPPGLDSAALVEHIVERVRRFTGSAEQSDDLTLMVISVPKA